MSRGKNNTQRSLNHAPRSSSGQLLEFIPLRSIKKELLVNSKVTVEDYKMHGSTPTISTNLEFNKQGRLLALYLLNLFADDQEGTLGLVKDLAKTLNKTSNLPLSLAHIESDLNTRPDRGVTQDLLIFANVLLNAENNPDLEPELRDIIKSWSGKLIYNHRAISESIFTPRETALPVGMINDFYQYETDDQKINDVKEQLSKRFNLSLDYSSNKNYFNLTSHGDIIELYPEERAVIKPWLGKQNVKQGQRQRQFASALRL